VYQNLNYVIHICLIVMLISFSNTSYSQTSPPSEQTGSMEGVMEEENVVTYTASFFSRFQPNSALDMLEQLPGFLMSISGELRGYGSDTGNVLVNGRRPSSKRVTVPSLLDRIPANLVEKIELIRGPVRNIEMQGEPEVANVVLKTDVPAAVRWAFSGYKNFDMEPVPIFTNISIADNWNGIDYNAGLDVFRVAQSDRNREEIRDIDNILTEKRLEDGNEREFEANFDLTASTWVDETLYTWASQFGIQEGGEDFLSLRTPQVPGSRTRSEVLFTDTGEVQFEAGLIAERNLSEFLKGTFLVFATRENEDETATERSFDPDENLTEEKMRISNQIEKEGILRTEFEYSALDSHNLRFTLEGAYNEVANTVDQTTDIGAGAVTVFVPGENTTIKETRGDFLIKDIWALGDYELDYGLGFEISKLTTSGDQDTEQNLKFLKPHAELSYTPDESMRARIRVAREVAQLRFTDYISFSLFSDDDVALGNPNLRPETTWKTEVGYERRFGQENVFKITLFHHWIDDVQDLIPLATAEAPGNIGDARRWGLRFEGTAELDWMGLHNGRLDVNLKWQDSTVVDPITGLDRVLNATIITASSQSIFDTDNEYVAVIDFRQDFEEIRVAWGWDMTLEADLPVFKVDELDVRDKDPLINLFVETTRWFGIKTRIDVNNVTNMTERRTRSNFIGQRDLSLLDFRQLQHRKDGIEVGLTISGSF
jgi:outer membrane receptor protein involved in Fe transport